MEVFSFHFPLKQALKLCFITCCFVFLFSFKPNYKGMEFKVYDAAFAKHCQRIRKTPPKKQNLRKNHHPKNKIFRFHLTNPKQNVALFCKRQKHHFRRCQRFTLPRTPKKLRKITRNFHPQPKQRRKNQNWVASKKCFGAIEVWVLKKLQFYKNMQKNYSNGFCLFV